MKKNIDIKIIGLIVLFIVWTLLIITNNISWFDNAIYNFIINFKSNTLTSIMKTITALANPLTIIIFCLILLIPLIWHNRKGLYIIALTITSTLINLIIKNIIQRDRPLVLRLIEEDGFSFPSGHAMGSICFYGGIIFLIKKSNMNKNIKLLIMILLSLIILSIGISRIYLGVHYASDIVGGFILGFIILKIINKTIERKRVEE